MATQVPPVTEQPKPPELTEQEITDAYVEARLEGKSEDLPVPPPTIAETKPAETPPVVEETPQVKDIQATNDYIEERKRKKRGGAQARIDELTKEKERIAKEKEELEAKVAAATPAPVVEEPKKEEPPPAEPPKEPEKPPVETPLEQITAPKLADYDDIDKYNADLALWAAKQVGAPTKPAEVTPAAAPPATPQHLQVRKEEFDRFLEKGKTFIAGHPDFNEVLQAAHIRGLTISEEARIAITKKAVPEVAYWLAKPENDLAARRMMEMDPFEQTIEIGRIAERLSANPSDFVSQAPPPGIKLAGGTYRTDVPLNQITDTDEYIRIRRQQRQARRGR